MTATYVGDKKEITVNTKYHEVKLTINSVLSLLMGQGSGPNNIACHPMVHFYWPGDILSFYYYTFIVLVIL